MFDTLLASEPLALVDRASGLVVRILLYSSSRHQCSSLRSGDESQIFFGDRSVELGVAQATLQFAGASFAVSYAVDRSGATSLSLRVLQTPEWGLRLWFCFQVGTVDEVACSTLRRGDPEPFLRSPRYEIAGKDHQRYVLEVSERCVDSVEHAHFDEIADAFLRHGYYQRLNPSPTPAVVTFRFNAMTEAVTLRLVPIDGDGVGATSTQKATVAGGEIVGGLLDGEFPIDFVRRVGGSALGWGKVWDRTHDSVIVASSRRWIDNRFGGWNIWQCDGWLHLIMAARIGERELAEIVFESMSLLLTDRPHAAALMSGTTQWIDRNHPPYGALALWEYVSAFGMTPRVKQWVHQQVEEFAWWFAARDGNGNGLLEYGSDPVGDGHFVHTLQAAMDEAAMDNSAVWDEAHFVVTTHTMDIEDIGLNSLLVLQGELLGHLLEECEPEATSLRNELRARTDHLRSLVTQELWDPEREIFAARHWDGRFVASLAPTSFYPLLANCADAQQIQGLLSHLDNEQSFGGGPLVPGSNRLSPASSDNTYWRGRIWTPFNYLVYLGLRRARTSRWATDVAISSFRQIAQAQTQGLCPENFSQSSWEIDVEHDCEPQYTWGAMMSYLASLEIAMVTPWHGIELGLDEKSYRRWCEVLQSDHRTLVGQVCHRGRRYGVTVSEETMVVTCDEVVVLESDRPVRLWNLQVREGMVTGVIESSIETLLRSGVRICRVGGAGVPESFVL